MRWEAAVAGGGGGGVLGEWIVGMAASLAGRDVNDTAGKGQMGGKDGSILCYYEAEFSTSRVFRCL